MSTQTLEKSPIEILDELEAMLEADPEFRAQFEATPGTAVVARHMDLELPVETGPRTLSELFGAMPPSTARSTINTVRLLVGDVSPRQPVAWWGANTNGAVNFEVVTNAVGYHEVAGAEYVGGAFVAVAVAVFTFVGAPEEARSMGHGTMTLTIDEGIDQAKFAYLRDGLNLSHARQLALLRRSALEGEAISSEFTEDGYEHRIARFETDRAVLRVESLIGLDDIKILDAVAVAA